MSPSNAMQITRKAALGIFACLLVGCAGTQPLMPTPTLYVGPNARPLFEEPASTKLPRPIELLYVTDRAPEAPEHVGSTYTAERSRFLAFGSARVEFADAETLALVMTTELGRFPPIPYPLTGVRGGMARAPSVLEAHAQAKERLQRALATRLAESRRKEVVLFVHGYRVTFEEAALTMSQLCHFLGREFVCGIFTWPAGGDRGILFGYDVDRESAEYAVEDLVKTIRIVAGTPGLEKIHFVAHSRGTDTLASALAILSVESYVRKSSPAREFHIGNVVLVAPDLDGDVALTKIFKVFSDPDLPFGGPPEPGTIIPPSPGLKVTMYVSRDDKALATASWLSGSIARLGRVDASMFSPEQITMISDLDAVDIIEVHGTTDLFGHSYLVSNPKVSADVIALLRYGLGPHDPARSLLQVAGPFWRVSPD